MTNTFSPRSMPVSRPVGGNGCVGTSAQEKHTYHPSASREIVTVLGIPSSGRLQRTPIRPILERIRKPLSRSGTESRVVVQASDEALSPPTASHPSLATSWLHH